MKKIVSISSPSADAVFVGYDDGSVVLRQLTQNIHYPIIWYWHEYIVQPALDR